MDSMYEIRKATREEAWAIRRLIWQVGINPFGLDWQRFVVAVDHQDALIGCAQLKTHADGSCELASVAVAQAHRSQGIAGKMIRCLLRGVQGDIYLTCRESLTGLYERFGFTEVNDAEEMPAYFRRVKKLFTLLQKLLRRPEGLAVMLCRCCASYQN